VIFSDFLASAKRHEYDSLPSALEYVRDMYDDTGSPDPVAIWTLDDDTWLEELPSGDFRLYLGQGEYEGTLRNMAVVAWHDLAVDNPDYCEGRMPVATGTFLSLGRFRQYRTKRTLETIDDDILEAIEDAEEQDQVSFVFLYPHRSYITAHKDGQYHLVLDCGEWITKDLGSLEELLYSFVRSEVEGVQ